MAISALKRLAHLISKRKTLSNALPAIASFLGFFVVVLSVLRQPPDFYFDERAYVSAARRFWLDGGNENWSHPPLGKFLIALSIRIFGDGPLGWRFASLVFGSFSCAIIFIWAQRFFRSRMKAVFVVVLCFTNQIHLMESRVATLDVFMVCFMLVGFAFLSVYFLEDNSAKTENVCLGSAGISFALATACKWFGIIGWVICAAMMLGEGRQKPSFEQRRLVKKMAAIFACMIAVYLVVSYVWFLSSKLPTWGQRDSVGFFELQFRMLRAHLAFENSDQPYQSSWWTWPIMLRPSWYTASVVTINGSNMYSSYLCMANPALLLIGLAATIFLFFKMKGPQAKKTRWLIFMYLGLWLSWAVIPRHTQFFFYYYPAVMIIPFLICHALDLLKSTKAVYIAVALICLASFVYFEPLSNGQWLDQHSYSIRMLLSTWL